MKLQLMTAEDFEADLTTPTARPSRTPNCYQCGRFCKIIRDVVEYDGWGNQNYVTFDCKSCGVYTEGMW